MYTEEICSVLTSGKTLMESTDSSVNGSDIKALLRDELQTLKSEIEQAEGQMPDRTTNVHLWDILERIDEILDV